MGEEKKDREEVTMRAAFRLALVITIAAGIIGAKKPNLPTQEAVASDDGCIHAANIHSAGRFGGRIISAMVSNWCSMTITAVIRFGYYDDHGEQYGDGAEAITLAGGAHRQIYHDGSNAPNAGRWKYARIIQVQ